MFAVEVGEPEMQYLAVLLQMHQMVHRLVVVRVVVVPPDRNTHTHVSTTITSNSTYSNDMETSMYIGFGDGLS